MRRNKCDSSPFVASEAVRKGVSLVHPNSPIRLIFDLCSLVILLYDLTMIPFVVAWDLDFGGFVEWSSYLTASFWSVDLFMNCITGYVQDGELEMRPHLVAKKYLGRAFLPDFMILFCDWTSILISTQTSAEGSGDAAQRLRMLRFAKMSKLIRVAGLLRLIRLLRVIEEFVDRSVSEVHRLLLTVIGLFFLILWLNHLLCCVWYWIGWNAPSDTELRWITLGDAGDVVYGDRDILFQYITSFHWSIAQLTLGAIEVNATNTWERIYSIFLLLVGLLFSSTLVSSLSATMIDFQMRMNTTYQRVRMLRNYLRQNKVDGILSHRVMQQAEKRVANKEKLCENDVVMLHSLSASLRAELRFYIFKPHLQRHPLFRLWVNLSAATARQLCYDGGALEYIFLQPLDDLFVAGEQADAAFCLVSGTLWYIQEPEYSPVDVKRQSLVENNAWLCESALWVSWICVGSTEAQTTCQVLQIRADGVFSAMQKHQLIKEITVGYGSHFSSRIVTAGPPTSEYPTDLEVPFTDFGEIVASMEHNLQILIARDALQKWSDTPCAADAFSKFPTYAMEQAHLELVTNVFHGRKVKEVDVVTMEREVSDGQAVVVLNGDGKVQRVVSLVAFEVTNEEVPGQVFVQLGTVQQEALVADCTLPGARLLRGETPMVAVNRIMETKLYGVQQNISIESLVRESEYKDSGVDWLEKIYLRTVAHSIMCGPFLAPTVRVRRPTELPLEEAYVVHNPQNGGIVLYGWVQRSYYDFLKTAEGEHALQNWLSLLEIDDCGQQTLGHKLVLRF